MKHNARFIDITGKIFGKLTVVKYVKTVDGRAIWLCRCQCGFERELAGKQLREGHNTSCGRRGECHQNYKHGESRTQQYRKNYNRNRRLESYGLTQESYEKLFQEQDGKCKICSISKDTLHIDHNHETGEVRGLLCNNCNSGIGKLQDSIELLQKAIRYLT